GGRGSRGGTSGAAPTRTAGLSAGARGRARPPPYVSREEMMQVPLRMGRATYLTLSTTEHESDWRAGIRDGLTRLPPHELAALDWVNRQMRELIDAATSSRAAVGDGARGASQLGRPRGTGPEQV